MRVEPPEIFLTPSSELGYSENLEVGSQQTPNLPTP